MDFGEKMKMLLSQKGMSQKAFAEKIGMNYAHANKFFTGRKPNMEFLSKVIEVFPDANLKWLLFSQGEHQEDGSLQEENAPESITKAIAYLEEIEEKISNLKSILTQS